MRKGFTLVELLVVIAIIAILAVVVVLTLNPAALLQQSRDSNRLSDLSTMNNAINIYNTDQSGNASYSLGAASTMYLSIVDSSATSTAGTNCSTMGLPATSTVWTDHCAASSTLRNVNGNGWIPVNFSNITSGSPFGSLPVDPTNNTSSLFYYAYLTNGSTYALAAPLESQKYLKQELIIPDIDPTRVTAGNNLALLPQGEGLVGYWSLDEGSGMTAFDGSGNGNNGTWNGTASGTSGYYSAGKVGNWAGYFNGSNDYVNAGTSTAYQFTGPFTISAWVNPSGIGVFVSKEDAGGNGYIFADYTSSTVNFCIFNGSTQNCEGYGGGTNAPPEGAWSFVVAVYNGSSLSYYLNGSFVSLTTTTIVPTVSTGPLVIGLTQRGGFSDFSGLIDDVRIYNRALSATEIQAIYNAEH